MSDFESQGEAKSPSNPEMSRKENEFSERVRPNVFLFTDYKAFMKEMIEYMRSQDRRISLRHIAREAGLSSGYLTIIFKSKQEMAPKSLEKVCNALGLSVAEKSYVHTLRQMSEPASQEGPAVLKRLKKFGRFRDQRPDELAMINYLGAWFHIVIREMAQDPDFQLDAEWIRERLQFPVDTWEIEKSIKFLVDKNFLEKTGKKKAKPVERRFECDDRVYRVALISLYRQWFDLASTAMDRVSSEERFIYGHTMAVDDEGFLKAQEILKDAVDKIAELGLSGKSQSRVYNFGFNVIPMTKSSK